MIDATSLDNRRQGKSFLLFFCVALPPIFSESIAAKFYGESSRQIGLFIACGVSQLTFWILARRSRDRDLLTTMAVALGIQIGQLIGDWQPHSNDSWPMLLPRYMLLLFAVAAVVWTFSDTFRFRRKAGSQIPWSE